MKAKKFLETIKSAIHSERSKPLSVSIMGQTGVGKSSLLNSLFNTRLETSDVKPCTKIIERIVVKGMDDYEIHFFDMPGIGESSSADELYLADYTKHLLESDIVLWAIHADSRSISFDINSLNKILDSIEDKIKVDILRKITIVLTKSDVLTSPPWILARDNMSCFFTTSKTTKQTLHEKSEYFQYEFFNRYKDVIKSKTFISPDQESIAIKNNKFRVSDCEIEYSGFLSANDLADLKNEYPMYSRILDRLYDNFRVIPCSARFRFNLNLLMSVIANKIDQNAINRLSNYTGTDNPSKMAFSDARLLCNMVVFDTNLNKKVFDLTSIDI